VDSDFRKGNSTTAWRRDRDRPEAEPSGDAKGAVALSLPLAERRDAAAQSLLGFVYFPGVGISQDDAEAVKWFRTAADQEAGSPGNPWRVHHIGRTAASARSRSVTFGPEEMARPRGIVIGGDSAYPAGGGKESVAGLPALHPPI
jgi:hypothetical protein